MNFLKKIINELRFRIIFFTVFLAGILVHGSTIYTQILYHDNVTLFSANATYTSGRYMLQFLYNLEKLIFGYHVNTKGFVAIICFALIAIICYLIAYILDIRKTRNLILLSFVVITFPYVTSLFSYTFTAVYYYIANTASLFAAAIIRNVSNVKKDWWKLLISAITLCLSMAVYQMSLCVFIATLFVFAIKEAMNKDDLSWKDFIYRCGVYLGIFVSGAILYFVSNKIVLNLVNMSMSSYQGLDTATQITFAELITRIMRAYREFFVPSTEQFYSLYYTLQLRIAYVVMLVILIILACINVVGEIRNNRKNKAIQLSLLFVAFPLAVNSPLLMANPEITYIHSLMLFSEVFTLILLIWLLDYTFYDKLCYAKHLKNICVLGTAILFYISLNFGYVANICYSRDIINNQQATSYFTRLISRMQSVDGYSNDMPVAYINEFQKNEEDMNIMQIHNICRLVPHHISTIINSYSWQGYVQIYLGYSPEVVSQEQMDELTSMYEVQQMPCYPEDGSIQIINDTLVVKFAD